MEPGEWGLGDLAYQHCRRILSGRTRPTHPSQPAWSEADEFMKSLISFYRARVENVINRVKNHGWCEAEFRGTYCMFVALHDIAVIATALEIRLDFELDQKVMFETVGPWPHTFYP